MNRALLLTIYLLTLFCFPRNHGGGLLNRFEIVSVNTSPGKGTPKKPVAGAAATLSGIRGDGHSGDWHRQVSLLDLESIQAFAEASGLEIAPGDFGENLTVRGGLFMELVPGVRLSGDDGTVLLVTQVGKECHGGKCAIFHRVGKCVMPARGVFCRVESPGVLNRGAFLTVMDPEPGRGEEVESRSSG
jgi:MOSC domain-containing protein YiiM